MQKPSSIHSVLAVVPHRRWGGHVVLTSAGVSPGSFITWNLRREIDLPGAIRKRVIRSFRQHMPTRCLIGVLAAPSQGPLVEAVRQCAQEHGVPVETVEVAEARLSVTGGTLRGRGETLPAILVREYVPELRLEFERGIDHNLYRRHAWNAAAVGVTHAKRCGWKTLPPENLPVTV